jgi:hypothetical protein
VTQLLETRSPVRAYGACLYCRSTLGTNDLLDGLPVGRRIAFDTRERRLWVVCHACRRWSLSAAYARADILEQCARHHGAGTLRQWSEHVTVSRHSSGIELIRLDGAGAREIAALRYGAMSPLARLQRARAVLGDLGERAEEWLAGRGERLRGTVSAASYLLAGLVVGALSAGTAAQATALGLVLLAFFKMFTLDSSEHEKQLARREARVGMVLGRVADVHGRSIMLHADQAWRSRLVSVTGLERWRLGIPDRERAVAGPTLEIHGHEAVRALRLVLAEGAPLRVGVAAVRTATAEVESAGGPEAFLAFASAGMGRAGLRYATVAELPRIMRLALEIAADQAYEQRMLACDPQLLEQEWGEAEALAGPGLVRVRTGPRGRWLCVPEVRR